MNASSFRHSPEMLVAKGPAPETSTYSPGTVHWMRTSIRVPGVRIRSLADSPVIGLVLRVRRGISGSGTASLPRSQKLGREGREINIYRKGN